MDEPKSRLVDAVPKDLTALAEVREKVVIGAHLLAGLHDQVIPAGLLFASAPVPD